MAAECHVWTTPALQEESEISAKRSGAVMYSVRMQPFWLLALM